jgi:hypothetical protein
MSTQIHTRYQPTGYYRYTPGSTIIYHDTYSNDFLQYATMIWFFHHWDTIDRDRFDKAKLAELDAKVKEMEKSGTVRDPNYTMAGVDPDLMHEQANENYAWIWWTILIVMVIGASSLGGYWLFHHRRY